MINVSYFRRLGKPLLFAAGLMLMLLAPARAQDAGTFVAPTSDGIELHGVLERPADLTPKAWILMLHGSGPHDRDEMISKTPIFAKISTALTNAGYGVIRYDRRGQGLSGGSDYEDHDTLQSARDAAAVLDHLRSNGLLGDVPLGLFGHSEGVITGSLLARNFGDYAFLVGIGVPGLSGAEIQASQFKRNLLTRGAEPEIAEAVRLKTIELAHFIATGQGFTKEEEYVELSRQFIIAHGADPEETTGEFAMQFTGGLRTPWNTYFFGHDVRDDLKEVEIPLRLFFAGVDDNVPAEENLPGFAEALSGHDDVVLTVLPDEDHFFLRYEGQRLEKHRPGEMQVSDRLLRAMIWQLDELMRRAESEGEEDTSSPSRMEN